MPALCMGKAEANNIIVHAHAVCNSTVAINLRATPGWTALILAAVLPRRLHSCVLQALQVWRCKTLKLYTIQLPCRCGKGRSPRTSLPKRPPSHSTQTTSQMWTCIVCGEGPMKPGAAVAPPQFSSGSGSSGTSRTLIVWVLADRQMGCRPLCTIATCCPPSTKPRRFSSSTALRRTNVVTTTFVSP